MVAAAHHDYNMIAMLDDYDYTSYWLVGWNDIQQPGEVIDIIAQEPG